MKLEKVDNVPLFRTTDLNKNEVDISTFKGKKLLISFFRDIHCSYTNIWVNGLVKHKDYFDKKGLQVVGIFNSSERDILEKKIHCNLNFPVIPDKELKLYSKFGIEESNLGNIRATLRIKPILNLIKYGKLKGKTQSKILPAEFLVNEDFTIHQAHYGKDYADHINSKEIIKWIK